MGNRSNFGVISCICSVGFAMLLVVTVWANIPNVSEVSASFFLLVFLILVADSFLDLTIFANGTNRGRSLRKTRMLVVMVILEWTAVSFFSPLPLPKNLVPNIFNISASATLILSSLTAFRLRSAFFSPENAADGMRKIAISILLFSCVAALVASYTSHLSFFSSFLLLATISGALALIVISHAFLEVHRLLLLGVTISDTQKTHRFGWGFVLIGASLIPALLLSANRAPLDPEKLTSFFSWWATIFNRSGSNNKSYIRQLLDHVFPQQQIAAELSKITSSVPVNPFWPFFYEALKYAGIAVLILGLIYFMVRPLLSSEMRFREASLTFLAQLLSQFTRPFSNFWKSLRSIPGILGSRKRKKLTFVRRAETKPKEYLNALRTAATRKEHRDSSPNAEDSLSIYFRFLEWAYEGGARWKLSDTPLDIVEKSALMVRQNPEAAGSSDPDQSIGLAKKITDLLEEDLFSKTSIGREGCLSMKRCVDQLCSLPSMSRSRAASS